MDEGETARLAYQLGWTEALAAVSAALARQIGESDEAHRALLATSGMLSPAELAQAFSDSVVAERAGIYARLADLRDEAALEARLMGVAPQTGFGR